ncbi:MAG: FadR family transcriptional regulator [Leucobacter sp.]|nr:FadR family transcriptional regulator [Leucobacter sp.]
MTSTSQGPSTSGDAVTSHHFTTALLNDPALNALVELLLDMQPGDRLASERELTQTLGLSRNTLRDRMGKLESMGVLERKERLGTYYTGLQPEQTGDVLMLGLMFQQMTVESLISVRHALERQAAVEACSNADEPALEALADCVSMMHETQSGRELLAADDAFHRALFAASDSAGLMFFSQMLHPVLHGTLQHLTLEQDFETMRTVHDDIVSALKARDTLATSIAVDAHFAWLDVLRERERELQAR